MLKTPSKATPAPPRPGTLILILAAVTAGAYLPALRGGFIWDDDAHVTRVALQSLHGLWRIWFDIGSTQQYYPVLHSAFWIEHRLWGDLAMRYHEVNVALHITAACLFAQVLRRLSVPGAWFAAFLFALHPVCVESVAWISEQKNTLSTVFYLLAALAYLKGPDLRPGSRARYAGATALFVLALLTKTVTATLPAAILVIVWWRRGKISWKADVAPLIPWFVIGVSAGLFSAWVERRYVGAEGAGFSLNAEQRIIIAGHAVWFYLSKLANPTGLMFIYPRWTVVSTSVRQYLDPAGALALIVAAWSVRKLTRGPLAALLCFVGTLFPALGFFNVYPFLFSFVADHFQYLASLGILAVAGAAWAGIPNKRFSRTAAAVAIGCFGALTWMQCRMYRDAETLYRETLKENPACWMADNNLGYVLSASGRMTEAIARYEQALVLRPAYPLCHYNLANALRQMGRRDEAIYHFSEAILYKPGYPEAESNLAVTLGESGRASEAILHYDRALQSRPDFVDALSGKSAVWLQLGKYDEAIDAARMALRINSQDGAANINLGNALLRAGRVDEAIVAYREAERIEPDFPGAAYDLANAFVHAGRGADSLPYFERALKLDPGFALARDNLNAVLRSLGRPQSGL